MAKFTPMKKAPDDQVIDTKLAKLEGRIDNLETKLEGRINTIEAKFTGKLDQLDERTKLGFWGFIFRGIVLASLTALATYLFQILPKLELPAQFKDSAGKHPKVFSSNHIIETAPTNKG
jgi:hypothetical protein